MPKVIPDSELRKERALRRLSTRTPVCSVCGENDWRCLEDHHIAGRKQLDDTALICCNCHRKLSDQQKDHPIGTKGQDPKPASLGHYLLGLSDLFELLADRFGEFGKHQIAQAQRTSNSEKAGEP